MVFAKAAELVCYLIFSKDISCPHSLPPLRSRVEFPFPWSGVGSWLICSCCNMAEVMLHDFWGQIREGNAISLLAEILLKPSAIRQVVQLPWSHQAIRKLKLSHTEKPHGKAWGSMKIYAPPGPDTLQSPCSSNSSHFLTADTEWPQAGTAQRALPNLTTHRPIKDNKIIVVLSH